MPPMPSALGGGGGGRRRRGDGCGWKEAAVMIDRWKSSCTSRRDEGKRREFIQESSQVFPTDALRW